MAEYDLFEMTGLAFDPPDTNAKRIHKSIEDKKKELGALLGRDTQLVSRERIRSQIEYLDEIEGKIFDASGKKLQRAAYIKLAEEKQSRAGKSLKAMIDILAITGTHTVTESAIRHYRRETGLSTDSVKRVITEAGMKITDYDPLKSYPKFPVNADRIRSELEAVRNNKAAAQRASEVRNIKDLYCLAAYFSGDLGNAQLYRTMDIRNLQQIFDTASKKYSVHNDDLGKLFGSLSSSAKAYVFDSEESRKAYDAYLTYHCEELSRLFASMKMAPQAVLLGSGFADRCMDKILEYFPDYNTALAIYNKEADFKDCCYTPVRAEYTVKCSYCGTVVRFESEQEAKNSNKCSNCGRELFRKCGSCSALVPSFMDKCPHCRYTFASAALYTKYLRLAEKEFKAGNIRSAREFVRSAQSVSTDGAADSLAAKIEQMEQKQREPLNKLRLLVAEHRYQEADGVLAEIIRKYPEADVRKYETKIDTELDAADDMYAAAAGKTASERADLCVEILTRCADHRKSLVYLRTNPPAPCLGMTASCDSESGLVHISWRGKRQNGVSYRLLRKKGAKPSVSEKDGTVLAGSTTERSFMDKTAESGTLYTYTVFSCRQGAYSEPASCSAALYSEVRDCRISQVGKKLRLTWDEPAGCCGARVYRDDGRGLLLISRSARCGFEDRGIRLDQKYTYRICADYGDALSSGIVKSFTPMNEVEAFSISAGKSLGRRYRVAWDIDRPGIAMRILINGKQACEARSEDGNAVIRLPENERCVISVLAYSGGEWKSSSNSITVSTYLPIGIDKDNTYMSETPVTGISGRYSNVINIRMKGGIPDNVAGFYYTARTQEAGKHWADIEDIQNASDIRKMTADEYRRYKSLICRMSIRNETSFYITVFTIYRSGTEEMVSEPVKLRLSRELNADLFWSVSYSRSDGLKLSVDMKGNRPIDHVPELILCACDEDKYILSERDHNAYMIARIGEKDLDVPLSEYKAMTRINTQFTGRQLKKFRFFLYEKNNVKSEKTAVRWMQGFSGKV